MPQNEDMAEFTVTSLRVVQAVVGTGSFTATAELLGYTQSAVSRQVAAAEAAAGVPLFVRGSRGVTPTPAGAAVARRAATALSEIDAVARDLAELTDRLAGRVVLGAFPTAMWALTPRTVADLRQRHPALTLELREGSTPVLLRQLRSGRIDVAVIALGPDLPAYDLDDLRTSRLPEGGLLVAVPRTHRLADWDRVPVTELSEEDWVAGAGLRGDPQFGPWPTLPDPRIAYTAREWPARLGLVAAGLGATVVPRIAADGLPAEVVTVRVDDPSWLGRTAVAATRAERTAGVDVVVATLRQVALSLR
ncbi:LysR family transcriptional regulator [Phytoactinopolyspora endophytica]|uniref:LysR family transcriptional regulator n=1 Tax=Phytoactinopolyspora endophytica TaxID=1642495 RepID=UPI00197C5E5B|nr:LysR substrate-binding domain-containing protein [Phytoactinopolyspora endophytica]